MPGKFVLKLVFVCLFFHVKCPNILNVNNLSFYKAFLSTKTSDFDNTKVRELFPVL